jgi:hypothetical protein
MKCRRPNAFLLVMGCGASKGAGRAATRALGTRTKKGTVNTAL